MKVSAFYNPSRFLLFLTCFMFLANVNSRAQNTALDSVKTKFNLFAEKAFQEKVYLHFDKSFFLAGDILWFKAYVVDGSFHRPADLSKVLYVEILDSTQNSVLQAKISVKNGLGNGSFVLPASLSTGNYKIRAYTNWMKNYSPEYYFEEFISVINSSRKLPYIGSENTFAPNIQFFPEGGNLVTDLNSKVAFKVTAADNRELNIRGSVINQDNDTVLRFQPYKYGMGEFDFTPEKGKTYRSVLIINNKKFIRNLPKVFSSGYVMNVSENNPTQLQIRVNRNANIDKGDVYLLIHTRQVVKIARIADLNNDQAIFNIDKNLLGDGVSHLTIFDSQKRPVAERLYFKRPQSKLNLQASLAAKQYGIRKKVEIGLASADPKNNALSANLSVAVYRLDSLQELKQQQILTYLWLSSDLKGHIENADDYLKTESPANNKALDGLMLTQGWRRFNWDEALSDKAPVFNFIPEVEGHIISGKVTNKETGQAAAGISTFLSSPGKKIQLYPGNTDDQGRISFFTKDFYGSNEIILQNNYSVDSTYQISIANPFSNRFSQQSIPDLLLDPSESSNLRIFHVNRQVQDLYSPGSSQFYSPDVDSTAFYGPPDVTYNLDDYTRFPKMEEVIKEYIIEASLQQRQKKTSIKMSFSNKKGLYDKNAFLMIDGVPFFDANKIVAFDPLKIKTVEVVNHRYLLGEQVEDGIFNFKTYKNDLAGFEIDPRSLVLDYEGLQLEREFYSPVYQTEKELGSRLPDFRDLLFWDANVQTDTSGKAKLNFYTSDQEGTYQIVIQGISLNGLAGSVTDIITIKK